MAANADHTTTATADHHATTAEGHAAAAEDHTAGTISSDRTDSSASASASIRTAAAENVEDGCHTRSEGRQSASEAACD